MRAQLFRVLLFLIPLAVGGCGDASPPVGSSGVTEAPVSTEGVSAVSTEGASQVSQALPEIETGDLDELRQRGELRILALRNPAGAKYLPRQGAAQNTERQLVENFAGKHGLRARMVYVERYSDLLPWLVEGKGDIIADNMTVTDKRKARIAFTLPVAYVREQIIARADDPLHSKDALANRSVTVHASDSFVAGLESIRRSVPTLTINLVDESISTDSLIDGVAEGLYDLTVADSNLAASHLAVRDDVRVAVDISGLRSIALGVRKDSVQLLAALNAFLGAQHLVAEERPLLNDDLPAIRERQVLRVLTRNNAATYFLWRGELLGFDYELANKFAEKQGLRIEVVVPPNREQLLPWLLEGRGDMIAASLTVTEQRQLEGIDFTRPYLKATEVMVTRRDDTLSSMEELAGRTVTVRPSSSYWETLEPLQSQYGFTLQAAPETMETEALIAAVASGEYDLTVADNHILEIELTWREDIRAAFPLGELREQAWAIRSSNPRLLAAANAFLKQEYRGLFYNITYGKYFRNSKRIMSHVTHRADSINAGDLSPYDGLTRQYADLYGFDWRLVVSQMYQESRFDPQAKSWVGAKGLMQVMPRTARELELVNLDDPETGLHAGVKYLDWLMQRFEPELPISDRTWFALASYNAGLGHVRDARILARQKGWDPDRWFDNVERAMLLLAQNSYAKKARHGYVRGQEPVNYVRQIRDRYKAYVKLTGEGKNDRSI